MASVLNFIFPCQKGALNGLQATQKKIKQSRLTWQSLPKAKLRADCLIMQFQALEKKGKVSLWLSERGLAKVGGEVGPFSHFFPFVEKNAAKNRRRCWPRKKESLTQRESKEEEQVFFFCLFAQYKPSFSSPFQETEEKPLSENLLNGFSG